MKRFLFAAAVLLSVPLSGQIVFEEVPAPNDFSLEAVRKSPTGEYFTQAINDYSSIYSSGDGQVWSRTLLPINKLVLDDIQFFTDGTPVLKSPSDRHVVRRDGVWYTMLISLLLGEVRASFVKDDTLFAYTRETFVYSLDKGMSFTTMFKAAETLSEYITHLWVTDSYLVLHHATVSGDFITVFNRQGQRVLHSAIALYPKGIIYADCGQVLIFDQATYFLLKLSPLSMEEGDVGDLYPGFKINMGLQTQGGRHYLADGPTIYRTTGCAFEWEPMTSSTLIDAFDDFHVDTGEGVLLYTKRSDMFVEKAAGSSEWNELKTPFTHPYLYAVDESGPFRQAARTPNTLHYKDEPDGAWRRGGFLPDADREVHYTPNGTLYLAGSTGIFVSTDNGQSFDSISLPMAVVPGFVHYDLHALADNVLLIVDFITHRCHYSLDAGANWVQVNHTVYPVSSYKVGLAGNVILLAYWDQVLRVVRINLGNGEAEERLVGQEVPFTYRDVAILEDGTIYFLDQGFFGSDDPGLYRYRFGTSPVNLGYADLMMPVFQLVASRNILFAFSETTCYVFDGHAMTELGFGGLPLAGLRRYHLAVNHHVYVVPNNNRIFRSAEPLTYPHSLGGRVLRDHDQDCAPDTAVTGLGGWQIRAEGEQRLHIRTTNADGDYRFSLPAGTYTVTATPANTQWGLCGTSHSVIIEAAEQAWVPDFLGVGLSTCATLDIDFSTPLLRRCFDNSYYIRVRNTGPGASAGTQLRLELDPFFDFISATHPFTMDGEGILLIDLGVLEVNAEILVRVVFNLSCDADLGMTHCLSGQLLDDNLCGNERSTYTECQENIGSYDPNDKRTFNAAGRETQTVDKDEFIYYHVRFQNTGTDTAFRVRILDTLSTRLDPRTLEMLSASHRFTHAVNDGPILEVVFDDIFLPDSNVNEAASHGFFKFRIKPYPQYDYGTMIPNDASIYFDYNEPVITPEALLVLQQAVRTSEPAPSLSFDLTPNPASDWIVVRPDPDGPVQPDGYRIMDRLGRVVAASVLAGDLRVDVSRLSPGVYHFALLRDGVMIGGRAFVKM